MSQPLVTSTSQASDTELVRVLCLMATGDQTALAHFYDMTSALVYGLTLRIVGDSDGAEDVTLEVYNQVWNQASRYEPQRGTPVAWLLTIARSRALDWRRVLHLRQQREAPLDVDAIQTSDTQPTPAEASLFSEQRAHVQAALASLAPEQREAIELAYYGGLSHRDIADHLQQPLGTIKTRIRLGMLHLRDRLAAFVER